MSLLDAPNGDLKPSGAVEECERGRSPGSNSLSLPGVPTPRGYSPNRAPTSAEIDAVIAAAIANAPPAPAQAELSAEGLSRSMTPLMTNLLPAAVGMDGRVNLFVGNLPYRVRWQDLKDLFRKAGTVLRADVSLGPDNRSRGYGTVLMGSREDAARAIDRFNGFTWQTRTLEVRPDRLPPEYESQPHHNHLHAPPRPPMYTYHNMSGNGHQPYSLPAHMTPSHGPSWLPGQIPPQRPPVAHGSSAHHNMPGHPPMVASGSSPIPGTVSPNLTLGGLPLPLSGQNTGNAFQSSASSPLAGSLTTGTTAPNQSSLNGLDPSRRDSLTPFAHAIPPETIGAPLPMSSSPALVPGQTSRPSSSAGRPLQSSSPPKGETAPGHRAPAPGTLGPLPPPLFAGVKAVISPSDNGNASDSSLHVGPSPPPPPVALAMEGLSHQGAHMGPPSTLHDRVVFVSNLPRSMQWQELKDMLRPAGVIIRADVATDVDGRPRGFGTALFATEKDAAKAVTMYNDRDIGGHRVRVHLERDSHQEIARQRGDHASALGFGSSPPRPPANGFVNQGPRSDAKNSDQSFDPSVRLPWNLQTSMDGIGSTPGRRPPPNDVTPHQPVYRPHHHPGPISMPTFPPMETSSGHNLISPLQTRNQPPMTPSMPGFVFNAYPETPPLHPHLMSPGVGPFSPGITVSSPTAFQYNPFLNPAPGAPVNRFPQGGSAALGTPTTQAFPGNPVRSFGAPGAPGQGAPPQSIGQTVGDYFSPLGGAEGEPPSHTPRLTSRPSVSAPSPLNAKDRLASTTSSHEGDGEMERLVDDTAGLSMCGSGSKDGLSVPGAGKFASAKRSNSGLNLPELSRINNLSGGGSGGGGGGGGSGGGAESAPVSRASLDGSRPNLGVWEMSTGERRASFGDVAAGRDRG